MSFNTPDRLFLKPKKTGSFVFDPTTAGCFQDMIYRSIPGYQNLQHILIDTLAFFSKPKTCYVDFGCSTGNSLLALKEALSDTNSLFFGIDSSKAMLHIAQKRLQSQKAPGQFKLLCQSILEPIKAPLPLQGALCCLTLHFLAQKERLSFLTTLCHNIENSGAFLLVEKIKNPQSQRLMDTLHNHYRKRKGYHIKELQHKKQALEGILAPQDTQRLTQELTDAGFKSIESLWQYGPFIALLAQKTCRQKTRKP